MTVTQVLLALLAAACLTPAIVEWFDSRADRHDAETWKDEL